MYSFDSFPSVLIIAALITQRDMTFPSVAVSSDGRDVKCGAFAMTTEPLVVIVIIVNLKTKEKSSSSSYLARQHCKASNISVSCIDPPNDKVLINDIPPLLIGVG